MRHVVTALMLMAAAPAAAAPASELKTLEARLQPLFALVSARTSGDDVLKALKPKTSEVVDECNDGCSVRLNFEGGKAVPWFGALDRQAAKLDSAAYYAGKPFTADTWELWVSIDPVTSPGHCFTTAGWNAALTKAGWPALKDQTKTYTVPVSDDQAVRDANRTNAAEQRAVATKIWESHKDNRRIVLSTALATLTSQVNSTADIKAAQAAPDCVRKVSVAQE